MPGPTIKITVDDSVLRQLIRDTEGKGPVRIVADGVEYGIYQEMGPASSDGRQWTFKPFMRPAIEKLRPTFEAAFKNAITIEKATKVVRNIAHDVEGFAKVFVRRDTGALANSIHVIGPEGGDFQFEVSR